MWLILPSGNFSHLIQEFIAHISLSRHPLHEELEAEVTGVQRTKLGHVRCLAVKFRTRAV